MKEFPTDFGPLEYSEDNKTRFLRTGSVLLKEVAKELVAKGIVATSKISVTPPALRFLAKCMDICMRQDYIMACW